MLHLPDYVWIKALWESTQMPTGKTLKPEFLIESEEAWRSLFPPTHALAAKKCLDHLDMHAIA